MTSSLPTEHQAPRTIGDVLLQLGFASDDEVARAIEVQERTGQPLGQILVQAGAITRLELASALAEQWSAPGTSMGPPAGPPPQPAQTTGPSAPPVSESTVPADLRHGGAASGDLDALQALDSRVSALAERLEAALRLAPRLEALEPAVEHLREELAAVARRSAGDGATSRPTATPEGFEGDLERVRLATKRLGLHVEAHDRALAELVRSRGVTQRLDEISARIDDLAANGSLAGSALEGGGSADVTAELRALARRVERAESTLESEREKLLTRVERTASSVDWRLRRLEAGAGGTSRP